MLLSAVTRSLQLSPSEETGTLLIQISDTSAGIGRGRSPPPPPLEHQVSTSATRPVPSGDHSPSSSLGAEPAARSFLEPPGQSQPACTLNNKLCILGPSAARGRFSYLSWRPALL